VLPALEDSVLKQMVTCALVVAGAACASLGPLAAIVQPPRFADARDEKPVIRLVPPSAGNAFGGASVRLWTRVTNPNAFGFTLSTLDGTLYLDDARAATSTLPLGLPLAAAAETVIPIDLAISFSELPGLVGVVRSALAHQPITFRLEGIVGVDAGRLGTPRFGPMTLVQGTFD
jgi:hypothetical protein